ncbi:MAG: hypothetical protein A2147_06665 [Chloroflexi bacterium RBG_16_57_8]|nr:MAG: hypothetical protein A2147_06665 [Chloroflexi bacterium RBG_16_57_8]
MTVRRYIAEVAATLRGLPVQKIVEVTDVIEIARRTGHRVFVFGNGGSAATATHMACDLSKGAIAEGSPRVKAISLCDNLSLFSAWANDTAYENVFAEQLENLIEEGDVAVGISGSGNSRNVLKAIEVARDKGAVTIGFCGFDGGRLATMVDIPLVVGNFCMEQVEDVHLLLEHVVATCLRGHRGPARDSAVASKPESSVAPR